jgi:Transglutaminase-like superfamily
MLSRRSLPLAALRSVTFADFRELAVIVLLTPLVEIAVRSLPLDRSATLFGLTLVGSEDLAANEPTPLPPWARQRISLHRRALRHLPFDVTCLRRSLILGHRLRSLHPLIHVGVQRIEGRLRAHAWVEVCGYALESGPGRYQPLRRVGVT